MRLTEGRQEGRQRAVAQPGRRQAGAGAHIVVASHAAVVVGGAAAPRLHLLLGHLLLRLRQVGQR